MVHLSQKLAEMHRRLAETAQEEQSLVRSLNTALNSVDETLLSEIRLITAHHEARRAMIMTELQMLAGRLCSFPAAAEPQAAIEDDSREAISNGRFQRPSHAPGNWRIAAQNVEDDLDFYTDTPNASH